MYSTFVDKVSYFSTVLHYHPIMCTTMCGDNHMGTSLFEIYGKYSKTSNKGTSSVPAESVPLWGCSLVRGFPFLPKSELKWTKANNVVCIIEYCDHCKVNIMTCSMVQDQNHDLFHVQGQLSLLGLGSKSWLWFWNIPPSSRILRLINRTHV